MAKELPGVFDTDKASADKKEVLTSIAVYFEWVSHLATVCLSIFVVFMIVESYDGQ